MFLELKQNDRVRFNVPKNPRWHNAKGKVKYVFDNKFQIELDEACRKEMEKNMTLSIGEPVYVFKQDIGYLEVDNGNQVQEAVER